MDCNTRILNWSNDNHKCYVFCPAPGMGKIYFRMFVKGLIPIYFKCTLCLQCYTEFCLTVFKKNGSFFSLTSAGESCLTCLFN